MKNKDSYKFSFFNVYNRIKNPSYDAVYLIYHYLHAKKNFKKQIYKKKLVKKYNIFISKDVIIGDNLKLPHPTGIVIGKGAVIGNNVTIYQQVTIGGQNIGDTQSGKIAQVKDNAILFSGCKILGRVVIEKNTIVGANSVILKNTDENGIYAGVPAKKLNK